MKPIQIIQRLNESDNADDFIISFGENPQEKIKDYILSKANIPEGYDARWHDDGKDDFLLIVFYNIEDYRREVAEEAYNEIDKVVKSDENLKEIFDKVTLDEAAHIPVDVSIKYHPGYYEVELWVKESYYEILDGKYYD